jgi:hypothetical protein
MAEYIEFERGDLVTIITGAIMSIPYGSIGVVVESMPHWRTATVYACGHKVSCFSHELRLDCRKVSCFSHELRLDCRPQVELPPLPKRLTTLRDKILKDQQELTSLLID